MDVCKILYIKTYTPKSKSCKSPMYTLRDLVPSSIGKVGYGTFFEGSVHTILYVFLYNLQVDSPLDSTMLRSVYSKRENKRS